MERAYKFRLIAFLLFILSMIGLTAPLHALPPNAVELISFDLISLNNAVRIEWETATEQGTAGYKILRGDLPVNYTQLADIGIIPADGSPALGAEYSATDLTAVNGQTYFYKLVEINSDLSENDIANGSVVPGVQPSPTPTPTPTSMPLPTTGAPTNTPQPGQATNTPTATQSATAVPAATTSPTATPNGRTTATPTTTASATPISTATNTPNVTQIEPSNTPIPSPTNALGNSDNTVFAQGEENQTDYPGPEPTLSLAETDYPGGTPTSPPPALDAPPTPYPVVTDTPTNTNVPVIGSQGENPDSGESVGDSANDDPGNSGLGLLWIGFIIAFLIFAAGVVGSIYFFARKQET